MKPGPAAVTVDEVTMAFGEHTVLDGVSLDLAPGQVTSVLGESGCGKTTLLRVVAGLQQPSSGRILVDGHDVTAYAPSRRDIAMVFQDHGLYPAKTVAGNIEFPLRMAGVGPAERRARATAAATLMHIDHLMDRLPRQLSGGQRQRAGICRAIVRDPRILLMDEPLSNLDPQLRAEMRTELIALQKRVGSTTVYVTHDQVDAMTMSDTIVVMREGRIEQSGSPADVFTAPRTTFVARLLGHMNVLPVRLDGRSLSCGGGQVGSLAPGVGPPGATDLRLGVRPEHLRLAAGPEGAAVPVAESGVVLTGVTVAGELLGTDRLVHVRVGDHTVRARVEASVPIPDRVLLTAPRPHVHLFDAESGVRLAA